MISSNSNKQLEKEKKSLKYYQSIEFLPIGCFYKIIDTGDLRYLLKLKDYEELPHCSLNLEPIWEKISTEYLEFSKGVNRQVEATFWIEREIFNLKSEYLSKKYLLDIAKKSRDRDGMIKHLAEIGIIIENNDQFDQNINAEINRIGLLRTKIKTKQAELKRFRNEDGEGKTTFEGLLNNLERYQGYNIDIWKISVKRWIVLVKDYEKYCNEINGR